MNNMKQHIIDTFIELSKDHKINKISINSIVQTAKINRSTFYYYFEDIEDLINELEKIILLEINEIQKTFYKILLFGINKNIIKTIEDFLYRNEHLLSIFVLKIKNNEFIDKIVDQSLKNLALISKLKLKKFTTKQEYAMKYIINAQLWLIAYWIENGKEIPLEELIKMSREMLTKGPIRQLVDLHYLFK